MLIGSLIITPLLSYMGTGIKTGTIYKEKTEELYAADAGIEDGVWQVRYDNVKTLFTDPVYDRYDYTTDNWTYSLPETVNDYNVDVSIKNVWIPSNIATPDATEARTIIETGKLIVTGRVSGSSNYEIKIVFYPEDENEAANLILTTLGVWLPAGFSYVDDSSNIEEINTKTYYCVPAIDEHAGGSAIIWTFPDDTYYSGYTGTPSKDALPGVVTSDFPMECTIDFQFSSSVSGRLPTAVAWVTTEGVDDIPYAWDADTNICQIHSVAGETEVEKYISKNDIRQLSAAIPGDYKAIGNSLMVRSGAWPKSRDVLLSESSTTVADIPVDAQVELAYLYWSGWYYNTTTIFSDDCADLTAPSTDWSPGGQTRVPNGDGVNQGTWTGGSPNYWDKINETSPSDTDYITGTNISGGAAFRLFNFPVFTAPTGTTITNFTIYFRARDISNDTNDIRACIRVNGTNYYGTSNNPGNASFTTYSYSFATNPATGSPWTIQEINGVSSAVELQQFGVYSTDLDSDIRISMVYAAISWDGTSQWSVVSSKFEGRGSPTASEAEKTLTMVSTIDLSAYQGSNLSLTWNQTKTGTLETDDTLYFAVSTGGGWSPYFEAFKGNSPKNLFTYYIPDNYKKSNFKIRLYFNFNAADEYVQVDNIQISELPADESIVFKIDDNQVYFNGTNPEKVVSPLTIDTANFEDDRVQARLNDSEGSTSWFGYFYSCKKDVTDILKAFCDNETDGNRPGNGKYTVGNVGADKATASNWESSYAGWSLIIIYSSPETNGHQLYLFDNMMTSIDDSNVNWDGDPDNTPGGTISGFLVPNPVPGETIAAKFTAFIGEGDDWYEGDYLQFNGTTLTDGTAGGTTDVWNALSIGMSAEGVDVDTFTVPWGDPVDSGLLKPGDTQAQIDLWTGEDTWQFIYMVLSFRSSTTTGGGLGYFIQQ